MGKAGGIISIIAGIFGIIAAVVTLFFGGLGSALNTENASSVVGLGWGGVLFSFLVIIFGAVAFAKPKPAGIALVICSIAGAILGGTFVAVCMVLSLVGGILAIFGGKKAPPQATPSTDSPPSKKSSVRWILGGVVVVIVVVVLVGVIGKGGNNAGNTSATSSAPASIVLPAAEARLIQIVSSAQTESRNAENDMQRGGIKAKRDKALCEGITSLAADNWIGKIETLDSNSDGKGVLSIEIAPDITVKTWNNALSDISSKTLIEPETPLFQAASSMKKGQLVTFSGTFFAGHEGDCLEEGSLSLRGKIQEPEYIFRFASIAAYDSSQQAKATQQTAAPAPAAPAAEQAAAPAPAAPAAEQAAAPAPAAPAAEQAAAPAPAAPTEVKEPVSSAPPFSPSFDCNKASSAAERLICSNRELAEADVKLAQAYKTALSSATDKDTLRREQNTWRKNERDACADVACMVNAYQQRISQLSN